MPHVRRAHALSALAGFALVATSAPWSFAQGFQDAFGPSAESRGLAGAISAGARGASASFINPSGLARAESLELYAALGLLGTHRSAAPEGTAGPIGSELELTPLPALSAVVPVTPWLVLGGHLAPASFQGGAYQIDPNATNVRDARSFRMMEAGPEVAVLIPEDLLPGALSVGVGYRVSAGGIDRVRAASLGSADVLVDVSGVDATGMRLGLQYSPMPELRLGFSWQNAATVELGAETGQLAGVPVDDLRAALTLPARVTVGGRFDLDRYGVAIEYRLVDYSGVELTYRGEGEDANVFERETVPLGAVHSGHLGLEMRLSKDQLEFPIRAGVAVESIFGSSAGVSPFDLPPGPLTTLALGAGAVRRSFSANLALSTRFGGATVDDGAPDCDLCAQAGETRLYEWTIALDFAARFGR